MNIGTLQLISMKKGQADRMTFSLVKIRSSTNANEYSIEVRSQLLSKNSVRFSALTASIQPDVISFSLSLMVGL